MMLILMSFSYDVTAFPTWGLSWVAKMNDATSGLLDIILAVVVIAPVLLFVFHYIKGGSE